MEVKVGVQSAPRELILETNDAAAEIERTLREAVEGGGIFALNDDKGGRILVPAAKIAYIEFGGTEPRRVGFSNL